MVQTTKLFVFSCCACNFFGVAYRTYTDIQAFPVLNSKSSSHVERLQITEPHDIEDRIAKQAQANRDREVYMNRYRYYRDKDGEQTEEERQAMQREIAQLRAESNATAAAVADLADAGMGEDGNEAEWAAKLRGEVGDALSMDNHSGRADNDELIGARMANSKLNGLQFEEDVSVFRRPYSEEAPLPGDKLKGAKQIVLPWVEQLHRDELAKDRASRNASYSKDRELLQNENVSEKIARSVNPDTGMSRFYDDMPAYPTAEQEEQEDREQALADRINRADDAAERAFKAAAMQSAASQTHRDYEVPKHTQFGGRQIPLNFRAAVRHDEGPHEPQRIDQDPGANRCPEWQERLTELEHRTNTFDGDRQGTYEQFLTVWDCAGTDDDRMHLIRELVSRSGYEWFGDENIIKTLEDKALDKEWGYKGYDHWVNHWLLDKFSKHEQENPADFQDHNTEEVRLFFQMCKEQHWRDEPDEAEKGLMMLALRQVLQEPNAVQHFGEVNFQDLHTTVFHRWRPNGHDSCVDQTNGPRDNFLD